MTRIQSDVLNNKSLWNLNTMFFLQCRRPFSILQFPETYYQHRSITTESCVLTTLIATAAVIHPGRFRRAPSTLHAGTYLTPQANLSSRYYYYFHFMSEIERHRTCLRLHREEYGTFESLHGYIQKGVFCCCLFNRFIEIYITYNSPIYLKFTIERI